ncbi:MAG: GNAT family N-acetyltransferase [Proteobacteria bacterium]|nr:GNAT family N-acetyltransferase [Pseudomonadota bacterium]
MGTDWVLRFMREGEHDVIAELWHRSKRRAYPYLTTEQSYSLEDNRRYFREVVCPRCQVLVAELDGQLVGLLALEDQFIDQLYVDPRFQGRGVGSGLLARAKELSPAGLTLYTFQRNQAARRFYERHGFRAIAFGTSPAPEREPDVKYAWRPLRRPPTGASD